MTASASQKQQGPFPHGLLTCSPHIGPVLEDIKLPVTASLSPKPTGAVYTPESSEGEERGVERGIEGGNCSLGCHRGACLSLGLDAYSEPTGRAHRDSSISVCWAAHSVCGRRAAPCRYSPLCCGFVFFPLTHTHRHTPVCRHELMSHSAAARNAAAAAAQGGPAPPPTPLPPHLLR